MEFFKNLKNQFGSQWIEIIEWLDDSRDAMVYRFPVYNQELQTFSPGRQLERLMIQHSPAEGIRVLDRGAGDSYAARI